MSIAKELFPPTPSNRKPKELEEKGCWSAFFCLLCDPPGQ